MSLSRVIEVSFNGGSIAYVKADTAYFYNNGILFKPTDLDLPASYQVHWADSPQATSTLETIGTSEGAPIPDDLWNRSRVIYGWIYLHPTEDSGVTAYEVRIYKNVRAGLPDGTGPTPAEQSTIDQLISALNTAVEQTGEDVESAEQAKDDAESARDNAQTYANNAQTSAQASASSAESASQSARTASASATASAESAEQAAQIKSDIEGMVDDAQSYAESALIASQASVTARDTAQGYAQSASASAQSASTSASNASTSAQTASTKATEASTSAQTATQKATEATQSASQALTYKTDAESAKTASQTAQGLAESARDSAVQAKTDAESAKADAESARDEAQQAVASISGALAEKAPVITDTASGSIASFSDGADNLPLKSLIVDINPIQDLSQGDPSPTNICPISGWTRVDVEQRGKNIVDISRFATEYPNYCSFSNGVLTVASNNSVLYSEGINVDIPQGSVLNWTITDVTSVNARLRIVYEDGTVRSHSSPIPLTVSKRITALRFDWSASGTFTVSNFQAEFGTIATAYDPYTGRSITINLGQTVYGGKLDVLSGELVINRAMVDLGTLNWRSAWGGFATYGITDAMYTKEQVAMNMICSNYPNVSYNDRADKTIYGCDPNGQGNFNFVAVQDSGYSTPADFKTAMSGVQLCYELATPITIQLTPNQLNSLYGVNNIWADSGDTEVEYRADTKLFIERLTAPDSADMIADANITSGQYFMVGNSLYKATANIANGSAIIVGTNCIRKSLSEALNEINA